MEQKMQEQDYRILAENVYVNNDTRRTGRNNNDLVIGPSGAGKTRGYVLPNIMQCGGSFIISDTKNSLWKKTKGILHREGYQVYRLDFKDCLASCGYNPFDFIRYDRERDRYREQDILTIAATLVPVTSKKEPFWELAARMLLECLIGYVLECLPEEEHTPGSVVTLFYEMGGKYFGLLMEELKELSPDSFALRRWLLFKSTINADRMYASILGILAEKLSVLSFDGMQEMTGRKDRIRIEDIGCKKTAVFVNVSDTDRTFDRLAALFYAQALQVLCRCADGNAGGHLAVPVRMIFDDFAASVAVPEFDKVVSVIRSRGISVSIILQSLSQLEDVYGHEKAMTIINNCDSCLYLGGQDVQTAGYIAVKADRATSTILNMPLNQAWLFVRGQKPEIVGKYRLESHMRYGQLEDEIE